MVSVISGLVFALKSVQLLFGLNEYLVDVFC